MATELAKQYDITSERLKKEGKNNGISDVIPELSWSPILANAGISAAITGFTAYVVTKPQYAVLVAKIKRKLNVSSDKFSAELTEYVNKRLGKTVQGAGAFFDLNTFINAKIKTLGVDNSSLTNIPKSLFDDAYKITPTAGSVLKTKADKIIANGDPGELTEEIIDEIFNDVLSKKGWKLADGKYYKSGNNGIDRIYYKGEIDNPTDMMAFEAKQMNADGSAKLNDASSTTSLPEQMRDTWLEYIAREKLLKETNELRKKTGEAILKFNSKNIQKYVVAVDKSNGQINFLRLGSH